MNKKENNESENEHSFSPEDILYEDNRVKLVQTMIESESIGNQEEDDEKQEIILMVQGELNIYTVTYIKKAIGDILDQAKAIVINLSEVHEFDTAGFQLLCAIKRESILNKNTIRFVEHSEEVINILDLFGAVGLLGDRISIPSGERGKYNLSYGLKKQRLAL